jgi:hypothetical protein
MLKPVCKICLGMMSDSPASVVNAIELTADTHLLRIGYTRKSDDSLSSSTWTEADGRSKFVRELLNDPDISNAWVRCIRDNAHYFKDNRYAHLV